MQCLGPNLSLSHAKHELQSFELSLVTIIAFVSGVVRAKELNLMGSGTSSFLSSTSVTHDTQHSVFTAPNHVDLKLAYLSLVATSLLLKILSGVPPTHSPIPTVLASLWSVSPSFLFSRCRSASWLPSFAAWLWKQNELKYLALKCGDTSLWKVSGHIK